MISLMRLPFPSSTYYYCYVGRQQQIPSSTPPVDIIGGKMSFDEDPCGGGANERTNELRP